MPEVDDGKHPWYRGPFLKLYLSFFLSAWGDRLWTFALALVLTSLSGNLQLPAISGFVNNLAVIVCGSIIGAWVERTHRLKAGLLALIFNNISVALSASLLLCVVLWADHMFVWLRYLLIYQSIALCAVSTVAGTATKVIITRDWVTVMAKGDKNLLAHINAWLVRVSQTALILAPLLAGLIMSYLGIAVGCLMIAAWNVLSFFPEYIMMHLVYRDMPDLARHQATVDDDTSTLAQRSSRKLRNMVIGWHMYVSQPTLPAAVALGLLYFTVLGFCGVTNSYIYALGIGEDVLALMQGMGALLGIAGSIFFPYLRNCIGLVGTGQVSLILELACLVSCVVSIWLPGSPWQQSSTSNDTAVAFGQMHQFAASANASHTSVWAFLAGVTTARFGLWMADLSITQIMQEDVDESIRAHVFGTQMAVQSVFDLGKNGLTIIFPTLQTFGILILISWSSIVFATILYAFYFCRTKRIIHENVHQQLLK